MDYQNITQFLIGNKLYIAAAIAVLLLFILILRKNKFKKKFNISRIDKMTGREFEEFTAYLFRRLGYKAEVTQESQDQGIDVIAQKGFSKIAVQTKRYSKTVGNKAVQEVVAGKAFYKCRKCIVVTNNYFTKSAKELAFHNKVELWDRDVLIKMMKKAGM